MNYSLVRTFSSADGEGLRTAVYFSGCQKAIEGDACPGCHNAAAWQKDSGNKWTPEVKQKVLETLSPDYIAGLSILGGEPFSSFNLDGVLDLVKTTKELYPAKDIWLWSGYTVDEVLADETKSKRVKRILSYIDFIVDGPFVNELKSPELRFRGSSNQRILRIHHDPEKDFPFFEDVTDNTNLY